MLGRYDAPITRRCQRILCELLAKMVSKSIAKIFSWKPLLCLHCVLLTFCSVSAWTIATSIMSLLSLPEQLLLLCTDKHIMFVQAECAPSQHVLAAWLLGFKGHFRKAPLACSQLVQDMLCVSLELQSERATVLLDSLADVASQPSTGKIFTSLKAAAALCHASPCLPAYIDICVYTTCT